ncbi:hypothetical protein F8O06_02635 [Pseudoclavibacter sp. CFCC 14310]|uniref:hypothetical protein n=1 Tax=Pseudoclavibacter sp. CFCC 14310 TaxID=2615180 RepID=UPI0013011993|nr:hypothetical protein [Pseudoclavibacter sp. CFCC 14310]KAB1647453.1 hypothetical protein F8O06_02635 [Pseudoclavibacter sp. CFCC 14310]
MMIDPAVEAAHTDDEIAELEERLAWLRRYRALCVGGPVTVEVWGRRVTTLEQAVETVTLMPKR